MPRTLAPQPSAPERQPGVGVRRRRHTAEPGDGAAHLLIDGRAVVNFCGNDYLGLSRHPAAAAAMAAAARHWGVGSGASHLITGHGPEHGQLERELAAFVERERALLFSTGYMANLAVLTALAGRGDAVLLDRLNHASLIDGALLSGGRLKRYAHADVAAASRAVEQAAAGPRKRRMLLVTDGVFSMDGDVAPLPQLAALAARQPDTWLVVDDAHGFGVLGATGGGTLEHFGLPAAAVPVLVGTLGKALGSFGAFVAGSAELIDWLIQSARPYIYTTALPQPVAAATRANLATLQREGWRRARVLELTARFRARATAAGVPLAASDTPIQPVMLGDAGLAVFTSEALLRAGFRVAAIHPPTVPMGSSRLRVTLSAAHTEAEVDALVEALASILQARSGALVSHGLA